MGKYRLKPGKVGEKVIGAYKSMESRFVENFLNEDGSMKTGGMAEKATSVYHEIEDMVIGGYKKVENAFVDAFLEKAEPSEEDQSSGQ